MTIAQTKKLLEEILLKMVMEKTLMVYKAVTHVWGHNVLRPSVKQIVNQKKRFMTNVERRTQQVQ